MEAGRTQAVSSAPAARAQPAEKPKATLADEPSHSAPNSSEAGSSMLARQVDEQHQGELQGLLASLTSLIGIGGPLVVTAGFAATQLSWPGSVWIVAAVLYLLALPLLFSRRARAA